ncbi:hypothetical protein LF41_2886 [Lysobacter dokdonensis DS-58]|uniref:Uncharacterized protein n=1 Tax=Lysobacter dokdonensis DS-58 TaxID=1300345 RepID=A0A0A2WLU9_9GAMM|nr:hypothetical protein LF41_2886 [Lysobacter dokdonensis DS-58]
MAQLRPQRDERRAFALQQQVQGITLHLRKISQLHAWDPPS